jgi:hypothetical protein
MPETEYDEIEPGYEADYLDNADKKIIEHLYTKLSRNRVLAIHTVAGRELKTVFAKWETINSVKKQGDYKGNSLCIHPYSRDLDQDETSASVIIRPMIVIDTTLSAPKYALACENSQIFANQLSVAIKHLENSLKRAIIKVKKQFILEPWGGNETEFSIAWRSILEIFYK